MTRLAEIMESRDCPLDVTVEEARLLNQLGIQLASQSAYWRRAEGEDGRQDPTHQRSIINCYSDGNSWKLSVSNAVGVIRVGDLQINVRPKIPLRHFIYLLSFSDLAPRFITEALEISESDDLLELVAHWFMHALEGILRRGLNHDYAETTGDLAAIRGQLDPLPTAQMFYAGRLQFDCRFDEFTLDTPLNRILRAAAGCVTGNVRFSQTLRRRAFRIVERLGDISELRLSDFAARTERRTAHYSDGLRLARLLLASEARTIEHGEHGAWSFLIPTAGPVEEGIRAILIQALQPTVLVCKRGKRLSPSSLTINPDLVFDPDLAVGDLKYKIYGSEWPRADLYQAVSFAAGYGVKRSVVLSFASDDADQLPTLTFGDITVAHIAWSMTEERPESAARAVATAISHWLGVDITTSWAA